MGKTLSCGRRIYDLGNNVKVISGHGDYENPIDFVTVQRLDSILAEGRYKREVLKGNLSLRIRNTGL